MISAGLATAGTGPLDRGDVTQAWNMLNGCALSAYEAADSVACIDACCQAATLLPQLAPNDPRRAATLNNQGLAALLTGATDDAARSFAEAGTAWRAAKTWVAAMTLESPARSSLHHLRLEARHRENYQPLLRQRQGRLLTAARAASLFNRLLCLTGRGKAPTAIAKRAMDRAVAQRLWALGPRNPEAAQMCELQAALALTMGDEEAAGSYCQKARQIAEAPARSAGEVWHEIEAANNDEPSQLKAAVYLTLVANRGALANETIARTAQRSRKLGRPA